MDRLPTSSRLFPSEYYLTQHPQLANLSGVSPRRSDIDRLPTSSPPSDSVMAIPDSPFLCIVANTAGGKSRELQSVRAWQLPQKAIVHLGHSKHYRAFSKLNRAINTLDCFVLEFTETMR